MIGKLLRDAPPGSHSRLSVTLSLKEESIFWGLGLAIFHWQFRECVEIRTHMKKSFEIWSSPLLSNDALCLPLQSWLLSLDFCLFLSLPLLYIWIYYIWRLYIVGNMLSCNSFEVGFHLIGRKWTLALLKKKKSSGQFSVLILVDLSASLSTIAHYLLPEALCSLRFQDSEILSFLFHKPCLSVYLTLLSALTVLVSSSLLVVLNSIHPLTTPTFIFPAWTWPLTFRLPTRYVCMNV